MTAIAWKSAVSGDWSTQADWNPASIPGSADTVTIGVNTAAYVVNVSFAETAKTLTLSASKAILEVESSLALGGLLTLGAGMLQLDSGAVISGGSIAATASWRPDRRIGHSIAEDRYGNPCLHRKSGL